MQKKPQTLVARFHAMFTTHILLGIIGDCDDIAFAIDAFLWDALVDEK